MVNSRVSRFDSGVAEGGCWGRGAWAGGEREAGNGCGAAGGGATARVSDFTVCFWPSSLGSSSTFLETQGSKSNE